MGGEGGGGREGERGDEVLWPSQPITVTLNQSVYLTTFSLGRLSPLNC